MLNINEPRLSRDEWHHVTAALKEAATCGCGEAPRPGSIGDRLGKVVSAIVGRSPRPRVSPRQAALRDFVCTTQRTRRLPEDHVPDLVAQGFNRAQIEAIALLSA